MKIGIIADDITGANATGVLLSKVGFVSATVVFGGKVPNSDQFTSISVDTDSRYVEPEMAKARVEDAYRQLKGWGANVVTKRIDSTIRGNLGSETDAILEAIGPDSIAVVVASYPDSGRVTSGGYLLVEGVPVQETDVAKDPMNPISNSYVPDIVAEQSKYSIGHIGLGIVLKGTACIQPAMERLIAEGKRIIVVDAVTNEEIEHIAESMVAIGGKSFVPVDPGPLSAAYGRLIASQDVKESKWILTIGSVTPITGRQIHYLVDKTNAKPIYVNAQALASMTTSWDHEVKRATEDALRKLETEELLIITTHSPTAKVLPLSEIAKGEGTTREELAKRITVGLANITHNVVLHSERKINGTYSSGGDVTAALCAVSQAEAIHLKDEVMPRAAYGKFIGGTFDGIPVVTKGGTVGEKQSIYTCVNYLKSNNHEGSV
jgi:uncharacterized protein YgbK (DUF1537 family)